MNERADGRSGLGPGKGRDFLSMGRARSLLVLLLLAGIPFPGSAADLLIRNARVVDLSPSPPSEPVSIHVRNGRIAEIGHGLVAVGARSIDARGGFLLPGLFDAHAHLGWGPGDGLREPSRPELWGKLREHHMRAYLACGYFKSRDSRRTKSWRQRPGSPPRCWGWRTSWAPSRSASKPTSSSRETTRPRTFRRSGRSSGLSWAGWPADPPNGCSAEADPRTQSLAGYSQRRTLRL